MKNLYIILLLISCPWTLATAQKNALNKDVSETGNGDVRVPLSHYIQLVEDAKDPKIKAPVAYALGQAQTQIRLNESDDRTTAQIEVQLNVEVFEDQWTLVPVLPYGVPITQVSVDGQNIQLVQNAEWMSWSTQKAGTYALKLRYSIDASRSEQGFVVPVPTPRASSTQLQVTFTGKPLDMVVIPSTEFKSIQSSATNHRLMANIPTTSAFLLSWRIPTEQDFVISRAKYHGELIDQAMTFTTTYQVEVFAGEAVELPLLPLAVILHDVKIDGQSATVLEHQGLFKTILPGKGKHQVEVTFQVNVAPQGPPKLTFPIPKVAISEFELLLPGKKDISFNDSSQVNTEFLEEQTRAKAFIPMTHHVEISWIDAIPQEIRTELRANANIYHAISAEEGVLYGQAVVAYEITHGETSNLSFKVPNSAQVNQITATSAAITEWLEQEETDHKTITVYLDRKIKGLFQLRVEYEQLLVQNAAADTTAAIKVPLIKANDMHRQRGIVALLAGDELTLKPMAESGVTRVGENQLPAFFRDQIKQVIAHTFKYTTELPELTVQTMTPERKQGIFDAQVDTLISLGEVTMRGSASIHVDVKTGSISTLEMIIPVGVNVLNVSGPSLRNHQVNEHSGEQVILTEFTQQMSGQFQLEVNYEYILGDNTSQLDVPTIDVAGAEVQHGRIAVEALTAVEIQASQTQQLSTVEINDLPQQLVLKTTNPILLAFKYVNSDQPHHLQLKMTRHQELSVQVAAIETAQYKTLLTDDGLAVTTARFDVRNSRLQFLRLSLPPGSEVWSVFVDGQAEKPAHASQQKDASQPDILIKMLNSASGFPVEVIYATPIEKMGMMGTLQAQLPQPDMVVTHSYWDVYLPSGPHYQEVTSNMSITTANHWVKPRLTNAQPGDKLSAYQATQIGKPLKMQVPEQGIQYSFEKLYANQSDTVAGFSIRYASAIGNQLSLLISVVCVVLIWLLIFAMRAGHHKAQWLVPVLVLAAVVLTLALTYFKTNPVIPLATAVVGGVLFLASHWLPKLRK